MKGDESLQHLLIVYVFHGMYLLRVILWYLLPDCNLHLTADDEEESDIDDPWSLLHSLWSFSLSFVVNGELMLHVYSTFSILLKQYKSISQVVSQRALNTSNFI